jgi:molybdopterin-containing oxidoreductase family membrane subunit
MSINFWAGEILLAVVIPLLLIVTAKGRVGNIALAGFVFLIGLFFTRYDFVIAGQLPLIKEDLIGSVQLAVYRPSMAEWLIYLFGFGVFFLLYFSAEKFLNMETEHH